MSAQVWESKLQSWFKPTSQVEGTGEIEPSEPVAKPSKRPVPMAFGRTRRARWAANPASVGGANH